MTTADAIAPAMPALSDAWGGMKFKSVIAGAGEVWWRIPWRCGLQGVGRQKIVPGIGKRVWNHTKTSLFSCESFPVLTQKFLFREMSFPVSAPGAWSLDRFGRSPRRLAPRRRLAGATPVTRTGGCENCWRTSHSVLCLFLRAVTWESVMSNRLHPSRPSPRAMGLKVSPPRPLIGPLGGFPTHEAWANKSQLLRSCSLTI